MKNEQKFEHYSPTVPLSASACIFRFAHGQIFPTPSVSWPDSCPTMGKGISKQQNIFYATSKEPGLTDSHSVKPMLHIPYSGHYLIPTGEWETDASLFQVSSSFLATLYYLGAQSNRSSSLSPLVKPNIYQPHIAPRTSCGFEICSKNSVFHKP